MLVKHSLFEKNGLQMQADQLFSTVIDFNQPMTQRLKLNEEY
jgi:hypothetical protein